MQEKTGELNKESRTYADVALTRIFDQCGPDDPLGAYQTPIREWATAYLAAPHPQLGREGPVCPFAGASIGKESFWVGCVERQDLTAEDIEWIMAGMISGFRSVPPTEGPDALLKTIVILFPSVTDYTLIDRAQRRLKERTVTIGLMIGQFYPGCKEPGIRNSDFRPLQSPVALLAIRQMVSSDLPFLMAKKEWIKEYMKEFGYRASGGVLK